jgi:hypothetical protein
MRSTIIAIALFATGCAARRAHVEAPAADDTFAPPGTVVVVMDDDGGSRPLRERAPSPRLLHAKSHAERASMMPGSPWHGLTQ